MKELIIKLNGEITDSNFDQWKSELINQIQSANKELTTDDDFATAEDTVKQFKAAEKSLVEGKQSALEQAADIQKLFGAIDEISEETRQARLSLEKQIKARKEEIKVDLIESADRKICDLMNAQGNDFQMVMSERNGGSFRADEVYSMAGLKECLKSKKTFKSMQAALDFYVVESADRINNRAEAIDENRAQLSRIQDEFKSLFQDENNLLGIDAQLLESTIKQRIATHEAEEAKRKAAEIEAKTAAIERQREEEKRQAEKVESKPEPVETEKPEAPAEVKAEIKEVAAAPVTIPSETQFYTATILINGTKQDATNVAQIINESVGELDCVTEIKLRRSEAAA